ncbi:aminotransferase class I/II-fold pyridoxal phosphate-dependent enzyme [Candidatus Viridilinea mediisalina]|uniref:Cell wall biogenesis protein n=1 Tax=Candidatus Viridilinea mediisalina TaxID=2024553 RepID=A0A2A6RLU1_9CHLR|nr:aminotransferase class I/II-fold pyridoxal phosphate-dependent enzyme [Candidatus Viridilinea mediisalina]PDW04027.1 cell wall biogenesis protein [Candidatus Viridilinea mediisalina]
MKFDIQHTITILTVPSSATIRQVMQAIDRGALGIALIVEPETEHFVGLVTDGDVRRALLRDCGLESQVLAIKHLPSVTAPMGTPVEQLLNLLEGDIKIVPLLDADGKVADLVRLDRHVRLPVAEPSIGERELQYVSECILTGWISSAGKFVTQFEQQFAAFCNTSHAVAVSNGTVALHLALEVLGIGSGDEVIIPSLTFAATANAVIHTGATPVMVDCTLDTWTIDPVAIAAHITPKTKAIIPVHLYGHPADMDPIMELATQHGLFVIEDAAEAHGARYKGKPVGSLGDIGCFSFYGNKIVTTGEGGMLTLNNVTWDSRARVLRDHGMDKQRRYWHTEIGYNYRLTNLQAAIGVAQMERIEQTLDKRADLAATYRRMLADVPGITFPPAAPWAEPVCWLYSILIDKNLAGFSRDTLMSALGAEGIDARPFFFPLSAMPIYADHARLTNNYLVTDEISACGVSLPSSLKIGERDIATIRETMLLLRAAAMKS